MTMSEHPSVTESRVKTARPMRLLTAETWDTPQAPGTWASSGDVPPSSQPPAHSTVLCQRLGK